MIAYAQKSLPDPSLDAQGWAKSPQEGAQMPIQPATIFEISPRANFFKKVRGWPARGEGRVLSKEELEEDDGEAKEDEEEDVGEEEGQAAVALLPARVPAVLRFWIWALFETIRTSCVDFLSMELDYKDFEWIETIGMLALTIWLDYK